MRNRLFKRGVVMFVLGFQVFGSLVLMGAAIVKADSYRCFSYKMAPQAKTMWCWAASAENSAKWERATSRTQYDAVYKIKGWILNKYPNKGGTLEEIEKAAEYISNGKESYRRTSLSTSSVKEFKFLKSEICNSDVPILVAGYYSSSRRTGGHAVAMIGYDVTHNNYIIYYDPWDKGAVYKCTYKSFKDGSFNGRRYDGTVWNEE